MSNQRKGSLPQSGDTKEGRNATAALSASEKVISKEMDRIKSSLEGPSIQTDEACRQTLVSKNEQTEEILSDENRVTNNITEPVPINDSSPPDPEKAKSPKSPSLLLSITALPIPAQQRQVSPRSPLKEQHSWIRSDKEKSESLEAIPPSPQKDIASTWIKDAKYCDTQEAELDQLPELRPTITAWCSEVPTVVIRRPSNMTDPDMNRGPTEDPLQIMSPIEDEDKGSSFIGKYLRRSSSDPKQSPQTDRRLSRRRSSTMMDRMKIGISIDKNSKGSPNEGRSPVQSPIEGAAFFGDDFTTPDTEDHSSREDDLPDDGKKQATPLKKEKRSFYQKLKNRKKENEQQQKEEAPVRVKSILKKPTIQFKENHDVQLMEYKKQQSRPQRKRGQSIRYPNGISPTELGVCGCPEVPKADTPDIPERTTTRTKFDDNVVDIHQELKKKNPTLYQKFRALFE
jgi:hypothetical protein